METTRNRCLQGTVEKYEAAKLDLRVLVGSKAYEGLMSFEYLLTECINRVNDYIEIIQRSPTNIHQDSKEILAAKKALFPSRNLDDELSQRMATAREAGESALLAYLHRKNIHE